MSEQTNHETGRQKYYFAYGYDGDRLVTNRRDTLADAKTALNALLARKLTCCGFTPVPCFESDIRKPLSKNAIKKMKYGGKSKRRR